LNAPILMTNSSKLDDRTLSEIHTLGAKDIYIVGGTVAISQSIQDSLSSEFTVTRLAGLQTYDTAAMISSDVGIDPTYTVYLANGYAIPDAIAISAFAAEQGCPILLTDRDVLPASTLKALTDLKANNVVLLGGTAVIGDQVESQLSSKYLVKRWGGFDRYDTQAIIFQNLFNTQAPQSPLYFTSGLVRQDDVSSRNPYADALLTAALAAKNGGFVAMLPQNALPSSLNYFLLFNKGYISKTTVVGNNSGVSQNLEQQLQQLLNH
ncbi:MAG: cell wall-binding repeat-containing protein, partial [Bacillota bacterium]|nr:cell wall-binding repeat-containing protein [Bacillota bacterium]